MPVARLATSWWAHQRRLRLNHILVATDPETRKVIGSVEVHTAPYLRKQGAAYLTEEQASKLSPYLSSLAVRENARGRGIGRALVNAAVEECKAACEGDGQTLMLQVEAVNVGAIKIYEQCGFQTISPPGCQIHVMTQRVKPLTSRSPGTLT